MTSETVAHGVGADARTILVSAAPRLSPRPKHAQLGFRDAYPWHHARATIRGEAVKRPVRIDEVALVQA